MTYKLNLIVTGADSYNVRGRRRKEQERNVPEDMESVCFAPFLLALLLSISGEEQDSEYTIKLSNWLYYNPYKMFGAYRDGNRS